MTYLITEDSKGGLTFWKTVMAVFKIPDTEVITTFGKDNFPALLKALKRPVDKTVTWTAKDAAGKEVTYRIVRPTKIIIFYDWFEITRGREETLIKNITEVYDKFEGSCHIFISRYGSIESVILGFTKFRAWVHTPKKVEGDFIAEQSMILQAYNIFLNQTTRDYYSVGSEFYFYDYVQCEPIMQQFYNFCNRIAERSNNPKAHMITTTERACTALLKNATWGTDWLFDKGIIGTAFQCDCQNNLFDFREEKYDCQHAHLSDNDLLNLGWNKTDICDSTLACRNMTARKKLLTLFENSELDNCFVFAKDIDVSKIRETAQHLKKYSVKDVLGISHLYAADEPNNPDSACQTCRLRESPAYKEADQEAELPVFDANQLPPPEPLPETTPQWNQQQPNNTTAWNPYQQPVEAWEQQPQYLNELPAPAGNPDNIDCIATSVFVQIEGYLFCTQKGTYGIWKEGKNNEKVISIVGLLDKQPITIGPAEKKLIKELRAEATLWEQKQIGSYGNGWQLNFPVSIAIGDKPKK